MTESIIGLKQQKCVCAIAMGSSSQDIETTR